MTDRPQARYLDSSVFVALLNQETIPAAGGAPRVEVAHRILAEAAAGEYILVTSVLSVAEARRYRGRTATPGAPQNAAGLFDSPYISLEIVDLQIAVAASYLGEQYNLKPPDAIHLATAIRYDCDELLVWDDEFIRRVNRRPVPGLWVGEPY